MMAAYDVSVAALCRTGLVAMVVCILAIVTQTSEMAEAARNGSGRLSQQRASLVLTEILAADGVMSMGVSRYSNRQNYSAVPEIVRGVFQGLLLHNDSMPTHQTEQHRGGFNTLRSHPYAGEYDYIFIYLFYFKYYCYYFGNPTRR